MIAAAGYAGILVALGAAVGLAVQGARVYRNPTLDRTLLRLPVWALLGGALLAMGALELALLTHDFSIEYVVDNHARSTPFIFTIASAWAALEGSIVLWGLVLAGYTAWVLRGVERGDGLGAGALAVMGLVAVFFFGLMATAANPFTTVPVTPPDGTGPNPLLQNNLLMAVHPPLLYLGMVGFTVPFAYALSALARGEQGPAWLDRTHRSSVVAWVFLTAGIALGGLWSYAVLGWGGYWAWDPVENASLLPWLVGTAFIHSAVVQRKRGMLQAWNLALVISTFALTILGTFLTRSGVVASVHSFTQSPVGPALLGFLAVILVVSFGLFAARAHLVASVPRLESLVSREGAFLVNNLLLTLLAFTVLAGTMYPLLVEAFSGDQVSVGRPFFDRAAVPLGFALLLAMGLGPIMPYRVARPVVVWERIRGPVQVALVAGAAVVLAGARRSNVVLAVVLATFVIGVVVANLLRLAAAPGRHGSVAGAAWRLMRRDASFWGGQISHVGVALVVVAITVSGSFAARDTFGLAPGDRAFFEGYTLDYVAPFAIDGDAKDTLGARIEVSRGDRSLGVLEPRLHQFPNQVQAVPTPAVRVGLADDLYLSLVRINGGDITIDAFRYPLQWLLWAGAGVTVLGGGWALVMGRAARRRVAAEVTADA